MATDSGSYNPVTDPDFLKAPIPQQHAYLMATDKDYAAGQPRERTAYLEHINSMNQEPLADLQAETNKTLPAVPGLRDGARNVAGGLRKLAGAVLNPETGERYESLEDFQRQARLNGTPGEIAKQGLESIPFVGTTVRAARGLSNLKTAAEGQEAAGELAGQIATLAGPKAPEAARTGMRGAGRAMEAVNKPLTPRTYKGFSVTPATLAGAAGGAAVTPGPWYLKAFGGVPAGMAIGERIGRSIAGAGTRLREAAAEPPEVMPPLRGLPFPRTMPGESEPGYTPEGSSVRGAPAVPAEPTTRAQRMGLLLPEGPAPAPPPEAPEVRGTYEPTTRAQRLGLLLPQGAERVLVFPQEQLPAFVPPPEVNMQEAQIKGVERPMPARIGRGGRVEVQTAAGETPEAAVQRAIDEARARAPKPREPLAGLATNAPGSTKTGGVAPAPAEPPVRVQAGKSAKPGLPLMTPEEIKGEVRPNPNVVVGKKGKGQRGPSLRNRRIVAGLPPDIP